MKRWLQGFTLVELAITLVIIGLVAGGLTVGNDLIKSAEKTAVMGEVQKYSSAIEQFEQKYDMLPGDIPDAHLFWSECEDKENNPCDGNGDGVVENTDVLKESLRAWQHLSLSGILPSGYSGEPAEDRLVEPGTNIPASQMSSGGWTFAATGPLYNIGNNNALILSGPEGCDDSYGGGIIHGIDAHSIDKKSDDGFASRGTILGIKAPVRDDCTSFVTGCVDKNPDDTDANYILTSEAKDCRMVFPLSNIYDTSGSFGFQNTDKSYNCTALGYDGPGYTVSNRSLCWYNCIDRGYDAPSTPVMSMSQCVYQCTNRGYDGPAEPVQNLSECTYQCTNHGYDGPAEAVSDLSQCTYQCTNHGYDGPAEAVSDLSQCVYQCSSHQEATTKGNVTYSGSPATNNSLDSCTFNCKDMNSFCNPDQVTDESQCNCASYNCVSNGYDGPSYLVSDASQCYYECAKHQESTKYGNVTYSGSPTTTNDLNQCTFTCQAMSQYCDNNNRVTDASQCPGCDPVCVAWTTPVCTTTCDNYYYYADSSFRGDNQVACNNSGPAVTQCHFNHPPYTEMGPRLTPEGQAAYMIMWYYAYLSRTGRLFSPHTTRISYLLSAQVVNGQCQVFCEPKCTIKTNSNSYTVTYQDPATPVAPGTYGVRTFTNCTPRTCTKYQ